MSANQFEQLSKDQMEQIQNALSELSEASLSLDPQRIEDAKAAFKKAMEEQQ